MVGQPAVLYIAAPVLILSSPAVFWLEDVTYIFSLKLLKKLCVPILCSEFYILHQSVTRSASFAADSPFYVLWETRFRDEKVIFGMLFACMCMCASRAP